MSLWIWRSFQHDIFQLHTPSFSEKHIDLPLISSEMLSYQVQKLKEFRIIGNLLFSLAAITAIGKVNLCQVTFQAYSPGE